MSRDFRQETVPDLEHKTARTAVFSMNFTYLRYSACVKFVNLP